MRRSLCRALAAFAVTAFASGCYTTRVVSQQAAPGPQYDDRQWFTIAGLVPLSSPAGQQCTSGLATAESQFSAMDFLINVGLALGGGVVGALACGDATDPVNDATVRASCASIGSTLVPFLIASRTVSYTCLGGERTAQSLDAVPMLPTANAK